MGSSKHQPSWMSVLKEGWIVMTHSESHIAKLGFDIVGFMTTWAPSP